jgi:F0F1-type ATP synthase membrane subunit b/b'
MESLIAPSFNLILLIALLSYKLKGPLKAFVSGRHQVLRSEIESVRSELQVAQAKFDEFSAKLKAVDAEVLTLREQSQQEAVALKQRISAEARRLSVSLAADARASADALFQDLKQQAYSELCAQVLDRTEALLKVRLTGEDRVSIRTEFSKQMEVVR